MPSRSEDLRKGNWFWINHAILDEYGPELGAYGIAIYCCLCRRANQEDFTWVGQKHIATEISCSRAQVQKELAKLERLGLITIEHQSNEHGKTTNIYKVQPVPPRLPGRHGCHLVGIMSPTEKASPAHLVGNMKENHGTKTKEQISTPDWKTELAAILTPNNFDRWIAPLELVELVNHHAVLSAPDTSTADYARTRLADTLARALNVERIEIQTATKGGR